MSISMLIVSILIATYGEKQIDPLTGSLFYILENKSVSWTILIFIYLFIAGFAFSWGPIPWIYCTEIFPLSMRAKGSSITTAANWATNCAISFLVPTLSSSIQYGTFLSFSIFCAMMTLIVYLFYPETKNQDLENSSRKTNICVPQCCRYRIDYDDLDQQPNLNG